jgi:hypothetical protein
VLDSLGTIGCLLLLSGRYELGATAMSNVYTVEVSQKPRRFAILAVVAAVIGGVAAFLSNTDKIFTELHKGCQFANLCARDPIPLTPKPELAGYDSPAMGGHHNQKEQCGPLLEKYQAQYPQFKIVLKSWEDNDKDWLGHVTYHYHCQYAAVLP